MRTVLVKRRDLITIFRHFEKAYQIWGEIIDILEDADLNGEFPFDLNEDGMEPMEPVSTLPTSTEPIQTSKLPLQPLPPQPAATGITSTAAAPINQTTGLTQIETALLSPGEQAIRLKQRA